jgi:hypothetical protein
MFSSAANYNSCERSQGLTVWDMQVSCMKQKKPVKTVCMHMHTNFSIEDFFFWIPHFDFTQHKHVTQFPCILALPLMHKVGTSVGWVQGWNLDV